MAASRNRLLITTLADVQRICEKMGLSRTLGKEEWTWKTKVLRGSGRGLAGREMWVKKQKWKKERGERQKGMISSAAHTIQGQGHEQGWGGQG
jgi:hypothetical protein